MMRAKAEGEGGGGFRQGQRLDESEPESAPAQQPWAVQHQWHKSATNASNNTAALDISTESAISIWGLINARPANP